MATLPVGRTAFGWDSIFILWGFQSFSPIDFAPNWLAAISNESHGYEIAPQVTIAWKFNEHYENTLSHESCLSWDLTYFLYNYTD